MAQTIIDQKRYLQMKGLMHGQTDDVKLVVNIIEKCDIRNSFLHILLLIGEKYDNSFTLCTPLIESKRLFDYISEILQGADKIPTSYNFNFIVDIYNAHMDFHGNESNPVDIKYLSENYNESAKDQYLSELTGKKLKPRKRGKSN
jgi:hypothetical protein